MEDKIERIQTMYDDAIEQQTDAIRRKCIIEIARLTDQMEREINWMQCKQRDAMVREMREIHERGDTRCKE